MILLGLFAVFFLTSFATGAVVEFNETRSASRVAASVSPNIQAALDGEKVVLVYDGGDRFIYYEVGSGEILSTSEPRGHLTKFGSGTVEFAAPGAIVVTLIGGGVAKISADDILKRSAQVSDFAGDPRGALRAMKGNGSRLLLGLAGLFSGYLLGESFGAHLGELIPPRPAYMDEMLRKKETWDKVSAVAYAMLARQVRERRERLADEVLRAASSTDPILRSALVECKVVAHVNPLLAARPSATLCPDARNPAASDEGSFRALLAAVSQESTLRDLMVKKVELENLGGALPDPHTTDASEASDPDR